MCRTHGRIEGYVNAQENARLMCQSIQARNQAKSCSRSVLCCLAACCMLVLTGCSEERSDETGEKANGLTVAEAWAPATPPGSSTAAVYLEIVNAGANDERLIGARTDVAARIEFHTHTHRDGMMAMEQVASVIVPSGESVTFKPHGLHLMLFDVRQELKPGDTISIVVDLELAGELSFAAEVRDIRQ